MASGIYNRFKANLMNKVVDLEADTMKVGLLDNSHSFDSSHTTWANVSTNELAQTGGYVTGGMTLSSPSVTEAYATKFDAEDTAWTSATFSAYHAVIYDTTASDNLICSFDFGGVQTVSSGTFTIQWNASGIITLT